MAKFALVSWIENGEGGRISTINRSWIRDFDPSNLTKVYLTEWREPGKKKPDEGWPLYKAKVLHASDKEKELRSLEIKMSRTESPGTTKRKIKRSKWLESSSEDSNEELSLSAKKKTKDKFVEEASRKEAEQIISLKRKVQNKSVEKRVQCEEESNDGLSFRTQMKSKQKQLEEDERNEAERSYVTKRKAKTQLVHKESRGQHEEDVNSTDVDSSVISEPDHSYKIEMLHRKIFSLESKVRVLEAKNKQMKEDIIQEIPIVLKLLRKVESESQHRSFSPSLMTSTPCSTSSSDDTVSKNSVDDMVEIVPGSRVTVSKTTWVCAEAQTSSSSFARTLLLGLFPTDILINSNLTGGSSKLHSSTERRKALDQKKLNAIIDATKRKFPGTKRGDIGKTINGKINELRYQLKKDTRPATENSVNSV